MHDDNLYIKAFREDILRDTIKNYRRSMYGDWIDETVRGKEGVRGEHIDVIATDEFIPLSCLDDLLVQREKRENDLYMRLRESFDCLEWDIDDAF